MARANFFPPLTIRDDASPIYRQIYDWYRRAILSGALKPSQRVPSTRSLAAELGVSRIPVSTAYEQLLSEGYFETAIGAGTFVARSIPALRAVPEGRRMIEARHQGPRRVARRMDGLPAIDQSWSNALVTFRLHVPALDQFPNATWSRLVSRHARRQTAAMTAYGDAMGFWPFREAIAEYLGAVRAVRCDPEQILVTTGSQLSLHLAAQVLLDPGAAVWFEEPGYHGARRALQMAGARIVPVPVDREGIVVAHGVRRAPKARAVYITPSHQYPLGVTMSAARRVQLLNWARASGAWIIEDDYDSEIRFGAPPVPSLQGLDDAARVIYVGTFSKVMFPALRLGYVVLPRDLVSAFARARDASDHFSATLHQAAMADFIRQGHFARHIRKMRTLYMGRRRALVEAIERQLGDRVEIMGAEAGMHLAVLLRPGVDDIAIARRAAELDLSVMPLSFCFARRPGKPGLVLGFGGTDAQQIHRGVQMLSRMIRGQNL